MKTKLHNDKPQIFNAATEAVGEHLKFIGVLPLWAQGHENEVRRAFDHYAQLGASEAINWLARNGRIV